ncbi:MAG TPA: hypothetical protein PKL17_20265 [Pseudomonadota bacterium]|jgi:hypothetical protein|nr:hypothetical protein [Pseudomonadota bacterium]
MILFAPSYDPATGANLAVAQEVATTACQCLFQEAATAEALHTALIQSPQPLFAWSHGRPAQLLAQHGHTAISEPVLAVLGARQVFAFACHTATRLGQLASQQGTVWWGYTGAIQCPDDSPAVLPLFVSIFKFLREEFSTADTTDLRSVVISSLAKMCEAAAFSIDDLAASNPTMVVHEALLCLHHLWDRLRVWAPDGAFPEHHPAASPPSLFAD